ncbi:hypothetical protein [Zooshikella sp. RANM57]|uniref:hypothetical protein n=1 Tax=Zooshikella sp. RANM57 TaxID=3425863 RepID=UPI003D6F6981
MNRFKKAAIQGSLLLLSVCNFVALPAVYGASKESSADYSIVENTIDDYLLADRSGIYRIQYTAYVVIHLKKNLPKDARFFLNGKSMIFQNVDTSGLVLKAEVTSFHDVWLEVRSTQGSIHQLLTLKNG